MIEDTIAAISTPIGTAGIGIVRVSGSDAISIAEKIFRSKSKKLLADSDNHSLLYGHIVDSNGKMIDEVLVSIMRGPHSFTAEDVVEINCHGGVIAVRKVLEAIFKSGARPAEPGEFSKRAFLNGRIDLAQAESVIDLITAKTDQSLKLAVNQLEGILSRQIGEASDGLMELIAQVEAGIDFPEHDIEEMTRVQIEQKIKSVLNLIQTLINSANTGKVFREGLHTVIIGKPNVGKSSLLNALLRENRAIVTDIPGTTRDVIEEVVNIRGIPIKLVDTAGIRETEDMVERLGVERTKEIFEKAELVLLMVDASTGLTPEDKEIISLIRNKKFLVIVNKTDLKEELDLSQFNKYVDNKDLIAMSLLKDQGLEKLEQRIEQLVYAGVTTGTDDLMITNIRHKNALEKAAQSLEEVICTLEAGLPTDCMTIDIKAALGHLGEITGETLSEDVVDKIFSRFCIGK